jgi:hypothetical protein
MTEGPTFSLPVSGTEPRVVEGDISIVRPNAADVPVKVEVAPSQAQLFGSRAETAVAPNGRVFGIGKPRGKPKQAGFLEDGTFHAAIGEPLPNAYAGYLAAREDSQAALIGFDASSVWEITFADRRIRRLFRQGESLADVAYGPDGRIIVLTSSSLDVYRREGDGAGLEQRWSIDSYAVRSARGGRLLFVSCFEGGDDGITVLGFAGASLRRLARAVCSVSEIFVKGGRVFVEDSGGEGGGVFAEVAGLDRLIERLDANPDAFAEVPVNKQERAEPGPDDAGGEDDDEDDDESEDSDSDEESESESEEDSDSEEDSEDEDDDDDDDDEDDDDDDDDDDRPPARSRRGPSSLTVEPRPGRVGLVQLGRRSPLEKPKDPEVPRDVKNRFGTGSDVRATPDGALYYGWKKEGRRSFRFAALLEGQLIETEATSKSSSTQMSVRWDRRQILASSDDGKKLWSIELPKGRATLVHDFTGDAAEDEVDFCLPLAFGRVFVSTVSDAWIFSLSKGAPSLEMRGELDVQAIEAVCDGRAVVFETTEGKLLRVWGVFEDGLRELAGFDLQPSEIFAREGRVIVKGSGGLGWFEVVGIEGAWKAAQRDGGGARYPRVELSKEAASDDDDDDDGENDDDNDEDDDDEDES